MSVNSAKPSKSVIPVSPWFMGALVGYACIALFLPGGYDAGLYYLRPWWPGATAPGWVFLVTQPISLLQWPLSWMLLVILTVLAVRFATGVWGVNNWWVTLFSVPMLWNVWLGQIELFPIMGAALGFLVVQKKLHPVFFGLALLGLGTKPQVGIGLALLLTYWCWHERGLNALLTSGAVAGAISLITLIMFPHWPELWIESLRALDPGSRYFSAAVFPYGMVFIPLALIPLKMPHRRRARMVGAVTLLASPYFATYHLSTIMTMHNLPLALLLTWLAPLPAFVTETWYAWGWIVPALLLLMDVWRTWRERE